MANPSPQQMVDLAHYLQVGAGDPTADPDVVSTADAIRRSPQEPGWGDYKRWMDARLAGGHVDGSARRRIRARPQARARQSDAADRLRGLHPVDPGGANWFARGAHGRAPTPDWAQRR